MLTARRSLAGTVLLRTTVCPASVRNVNVTFACAELGLPTRTNVSKKEPVAASARNHEVEPAGTSADSWPPSKSRAVPKYIARSALIGAVAAHRVGILDAPQRAVRPDRTGRS
jgi:hypothetical protein